MNESERKWRRHHNTQGCLDPSDVPIADTKSEEKSLASTSVYDAAVAAESRARIGPVDRY